VLQGFAGSDQKPVTSLERLSVLAFLFSPIAGSHAAAGIRNSAAAGVS